MLPWSSNIILDSQPPSLFSLVIFLSVIYGSVPVICNLVPGALSPIPTLPLLSIRILSVLFDPICISVLLEFHKNACALSVIPIYIP